MIDQLLIFQGGVVQVLSINNWWKGYLMDYGEPSKLVFSLQDPKPVLCMNGDVRVAVEPKGRKRHWDYEVIGSFSQRACTVRSRAGHVVAQVMKLFGHGNGVEMNLIRNGIISYGKKCLQAFVVFYFTRLE
jgi:hypothetical protein